MLLVPSKGKLVSETNLKTLLSSMNPQLSDAEFVFCTVNESGAKSLRITPTCLIREAEGISLILQKSEAEQYSLPYIGSWSRITCMVNSDLTAVGFLAVITRKLADAGIPVNAVSGYYHDHLLVPSDRAAEALELLRGLSAVSKVQ